MKVLYTSDPVVSQHLSRTAPAAPALQLAAWEHAHIKALPRSQESTLLAKRFLRNAQIVQLPSPETALLAETCALAYCPADEIRNVLTSRGFTDVALFRKPPSEDFATGPVTGWVAEDDTGPVRAIGFCDDRRVFLAFRGTQFWGDWLYNLSAWVWNLPGRHSGFQRGWNEVAPFVGEWLATVMRARHLLHLTGHSLGGAITTIAAWELAHKYHIERVVTLGSPRVGGHMFAKMYGCRPAAPTCDGTKRSLLDVTERYQHGIDIVTRVTPPPIYFTHVATARELPPRTIVGITSTQLEQGAVTGLMMSREERVNVLRPDASTTPAEVSGVVITSDTQNLISALGLVAGLLLFHMGVTVVVPFLDKLGLIGARAFYGGMHHRSIIYATLLSPSRILGDWLNRPSNRTPSLWPIIAVVSLGGALAYGLGGWITALWTVATLFVAIVMIGLVATKLALR